MWPFNKKKPLIRDQYLRDQGISTSYADAFRYSKSTIRDHLSELDQQASMWDSQLNDFHVAKRTRDMKMGRLREEASDSEISEQSQNDLMAQLSEMEKQYLQDTKSTREAMASLREVNKTRWLLENILDGTFTDPERLTNPPEEGWVGDWDDLFDSIPDAGRLDPERRKELKDKFGITDHQTSESDEEEPNDDIDPGV
jgi:hypothetical protein